MAVAATALAQRHPVVKVAYVHDREGADWVSGFRDSLRTEVEVAGNVPCEPGAQRVGCGMVPDVVAIRPGGRRESIGRAELQLGVAR